MKLHKKLIAVFLIVICLILSLGFLPFSSYSVEVSEFEGKIVNSEEEGIMGNAYFDNENNGIAILSAGSQESVSDIISKYESNGEVAVGIDVSAWQKNIDWAQVSASGVKYAMIRCGYRGYAPEGNIVQDAYFKKNVEGALNNGIYVGIYFYSTAINEAEALQEAQTVVEWIKGYDIKYPVAYDFEDFGIKEAKRTDGSTLPYRTNGLSTEQLNKNAHVFLDYINANGYIGCLYGSSNPLSTVWKMEEFSNFSTWVAHYKISKPTYTGNYQMWQCTSSGTVPGISGNVDIDLDYYYYFKYNSIDITNYMFDSEFYSDRYSDLKAAFGNDAKALRNHYENFGKKEGRMATPVFDPIYYLNKYPDLKNAFKTDYVSAYNHFVRNGIHEGRQGSKNFDVKYYFSNNPDLKKALYSSNTRALEHYFVCGINEGRIASAEFNLNEYKKSCSNYERNSIGNNNKKYIALFLGGNPINDTNIDVSGYLFDAVYYANRYADLKATYGTNAVALKEHYEVFGKKEGRGASPVFDPKYYVDKYADLKNAFQNDYVSAYNHFVTYGIHEGRSGSAEFDVKVYVSNNKDIEDTFGKNYSKCLQHYMIFGRNENRKAN